MKQQARLFAIRSADERWMSEDRAILVAYIDNTGMEPKNFPEGSLAEKQWEYKATRARKHQDIKLEDLL